jgi:hypothetical protein
MIDGNVGEHKTAVDPRSSARGGKALPFGVVFVHSDRHGARDAYVPDDDE